VLSVAQAVCVALPTAGLPPRAVRRARLALVLPLLIALVVGVLAVVPDWADVRTWVGSCSSRWAVR
jgi:hypothetical protein